MTRTVREPKEVWDIFKPYLIKQDEVTDKAYIYLNLREPSEVQAFYRSGNNERVQLSNEQVESIRAVMLQKFFLPRMVQKCKITLETGKTPIVEMELFLTYRSSAIEDE